MAKRLVKKGVTVVREGKRVRPEINKNFDFTADEIERIVGVDPTALGKADSGAEDGEAETASTGDTGKSDEGGKKPAAGKKAAAAKKPAADKSDSKPAAKTPDADSDAELGGTDSAGAGSDDDL
jgi:hypothetical protein